MDEDTERYRIEKEIGRGAMGIVYRAYDKLMERYVAFKVLSISPALTGAEREGMVARFVREAQAAGRVSGHPRIVTTYDVGKQGDNYFIAMELIGGEPLNQYMKKERPSPAQALDIMLQLCDAMDYAHSKGIIHRDLKPDNIFLLKDGQVMIADFGIARVLFMVTVTEAGKMIGSPGYMSPEQVRGGQTRPASDIFSAGVILYELLTGVNPFEYDLAELSYAAILYQIMDQDPPPLSELQPLLQPDFEKVVRRAMEKDPAARYASFGQFLNDLILISRQIPGHEYHVHRDPFTQELIASRPPDAAEDIEHIALERTPQPGSEVEAADAVATKTAMEEGTGSEAATASLGLETPSATERKDTENGEEIPASETAVLDADGAESGNGQVGAADNGKTRAGNRRTKVVIWILATLLLIGGTIGLEEYLRRRNGNEKTEAVIMIEVPDLTDLTEEEAKAKLEEAGLEIGSERMPDDTVEEGTVLGQDPEAGSKIKEGGTVAVKIAIPPNKREVPDVSSLDLSVGEATALLQENGLDQGAIYKQPTENSNEHDKVRGQDPAPGSIVDTGTVVSLVVLEYEPPESSESRNDEPERVTCSNCNGTGVINVIIGYDSVPKPCPDCGGDGYDHGRCQTCDGTGTIYVDEPIWGQRTCPICNGAGWIYK